MNNIAFIVTPDYKNPEFLRQKYIAEQLSVWQISKLTASSKDSVRKGLTRAGIKVRRHGHHHGRPSQPKFGKRIAKGREVDHKAEQNVVSVIRELRDQRMTLRQIASTLSQLGIPTKCKGKSWHQEMVRRVLLNSKASLATKAAVLSPHSATPENSSTPSSGGGLPETLTTQA